MRSFEFCVSTCRQGPNNGGRQEFVNRINARMVITNVVPMEQRRFRVTQPFVIPTSQGIIIIRINMVCRIPIYSSSNVRAYSRARQMKTSTKEVRGHLNVGLNSSMISITTRRIFRALLVIRFRRSTFLYFESPFCSSNEDRELMFVQVTCKLVRIQASNGTIIHCRSRFRHPV